MSHAKPLPRRRSSSARRPRSRLRRSVVTLVAVAAFFLAPVPAWAHTHLVRSEPARGSVLHTPLHRVVLVFSETAQIRLTVMRLALPDGRLIDLTVRADSTDPHAVVGDVPVSLSAGAYTVHWRTVSPDGHPASGSLPFTLDPSAVATADSEHAGREPLASDAHAPLPAVEAPSHAGSSTVAAASTAGAFGVGSPLYVIIRWLTYVGVLCVIGTIVFRLVVIRLAVIRSPHWSALKSAALERARGIGALAAWLLVPVTMLRGGAQAVAVNGGDHPLSGVPLRVLFLHTTWGWSWLAALAAAIGAGVAFARIRHGRRPGWGLAVASALLLAVALPLSGHAVAVPRAVLLTVALHAVHILAAGGWLGTIVMLVFAALPAVKQLANDAPRFALVDLLAVFSPVALACASVIVATGVAAAWIHLGSLSTLWTTGYGRVLLIKVGILLLTLAAGAYNWRVATPRVAAGADAASLRRSASAELVLGVLILGATAVLVATPPPHEAPPASPPAAQAVSATRPHHGEAAVSPQISSPPTASGPD